MSVARHHAEWLSLVEVSGPFLAMPVLLRVFPDGLDSRSDASDLRERLHVAYEEWRDAEDAAIHRAWFRYVLRELFEYDAALLVESQGLPPSCSVTVHEHGETLIPTAALVDPPGRDSAGRPRVLFSVVPRAQALDAALRGARWKASPATRMMTLLHGAGVRLGVVTNGEQWMLVHAAPGETTTYVSFYANLWFDEPLTLRALASLLGARRLFGVTDDATLEALLKDSVANQHEVTDQLGVQVRRAVEVILQTLDRIDRGLARALLTGIDEERLYEAAVTVMMRLVFLFAAEERGLLLLGDAIYDQNYAVSTLRDQLQAVADAHGGEVLQRRHDAWSRLLAIFRAVHGGVEHEALRVPAYGGSLFDPDRFPFLEGRAPKTKYRDTPAKPLPVDNLTVLDLLNSLQLLEVRVPGGGPAETRRLSFRALDVEQLGHVYEGLLDHTAKRARTPVVSLRGSKEPELEVAELERRLESDGPDKLAEYLAEATGRSSAALRKAREYRLDADSERKLMQVCDNQKSLYERVAPWAGYVRDDTRGMPVVVPEGSIYVTEGSTRRSTGTHYTPRALTEEVVRYTLEPLVYVGPAEGLPRAQWTLRPARALLALRVCDVAMGSGAFLVQACRYLAERLVDAWDLAERDAGGRLVVTPEGELSGASPTERPLPADTDERLALARRYVADRCLYGVDVNPMAVEMAKLSLWLVTLQKDRPFTFVDHCLKCGDSLLGVTNVQQVEDFTLRGAQQWSLFASAGLRTLVGNAATKRRALEALPSEHYDQIEQKAALHREATAATSTVRAVGDQLVAFELRAPDGKAYEAERGTEGVRVRDLLASNAETLQRDADAVLKGRRPFHWVVEFPEVFEGGGFDAIVGNPPFMGGSKLTGTLGTDYRNLLVGRLAHGRRGNADLSAYFSLRVISLLHKYGMTGLIATSTIAQGDTREVGLDAIIDENATIFRAVSSEPWTGAANLSMSRVWMCKGDWKGIHTLDGTAVRGIDGGLTELGRVEGKPHRLKANEGKSFSGSKIYGMGFLLEPDEAQALIAKDPRNREVLFPYLSGDDLNSRWDQSASRWVINFFEWPEERAKSYPDCYAIVKAKVKPERESSTVAKHAREHWWKYERTRAELHTTIADMKRVLVHPLTAKHHNLSWVTLETTLVLSHMTVVLAFSNMASYALLQSDLHWEWALKYGNKLDTRPQYTSTDCFETFPIPMSLDGLDGIGERYHAHRKAIMDVRQHGLTKIYNSFHDLSERAADIATLRALHVEMDRAVAAAYGWSDLALGHGFHETKQGLRYTISEAARRTVLDRLLALNHERYAEEVRQGLHDKGSSKAKAVKAPVATASATPAKAAPQAQLGLFDAPVRSAAKAAVVTGLDANATALLQALEAATGPLGKAGLLAAAGLSESAWTGAISALKAQGLVEQRGEKRGATYVRKR